MDNRQYWEQFYKERHIYEPSSFAKSLMLKNKRIIDMGCGNGRDTHHLRHMSNTVIGIDTFVPLGIGFRNMSIEGYIDDNMCACGLDKEHADVLYARFLLHAISQELEDKILSWAAKNVKEIYIECRSDKGVVPDNTHERRLINGETLKLKIVSAGFHIEYYAEQTGFALYKNEDPVVIRLVAKK